MVAGLPGFGLSGVFFVVSALLMLPIELVATVRGRSSLARWAAVLRSAGIALAILAGLELTYAMLHFVVTQISGSAPAARAGRPGGQSGDVVAAVPVLPFLGTLGLVALVILCGKVAQIVSSLREQRSRSGADSPSSGTEVRSLERPTPAPRPHTDVVDERSSRRRTQPHAAEHGPVAREREPAPAGA